MKSTFKRIGIIVFVAVIGFSMVACNLFGGKEEEQETQKTNTQTPGGQIPGGEQPDGEQPGTDPNHDHVWGNWSVTTAATCSATGVETRTCALDPSHTETRDIAINPNAHVLDPNSITKAPTCTETGLGSGTCTLNSSHVLNNAVLPIDPTAHNWNNDYQQTTAPTCTATGIDTDTCSNNIGHIRTRAGAAINPDAHDWNTGYTTISAATVTTDGTETRTCELDPSHKETRTAYATGTAGLAYELITSGTNANTYCVRKGTVTTGVVHIPAYYRPNANSPYLPVTEIGRSNDYSFSGAFVSTTITSVTFASNSQLKSIGKCAFDGCTSLTSITIPSSVTSIVSYAFDGCTGLTSVTIPSSVTSINAYAFYNCTGLTSVTIQAGSIGYNAFDGCTGLTSVTIQASVTSIGSETFYGCDSLTSVTFAGTIASGSFSNSAFLGDLRTKFYATDSANGTPGTYTRPNGSNTWTKQP